MIYHTSVASKRPDGLKADDQAFWAFLPIKYDFPSCFLPRLYPRVAPGAPLRPRAYGGYLFAPRSTAERSLSWVRSVPRSRRCCRASSLSQHSLVYMFVNGAGRPPRRR
ncbi:unnamed protein product [Pieris brassicae]|uniref:Uncharacterized protein n=1 Tax=Pieris brassicae TaxID=7116 RepID=A0A9P0SZC0_PIEBR|nr:unnamed protein product [Pieris brassicae]